NAGIAAGEGDDPERDECANFRWGQRLTDPDGMAHDQMALERVQIFVRNAMVGQLAEARVDTVHHLAAVDYVLDDRPRGLDSCRCSRAIPERPAAAGYLDHLGNAHRSTVDYQGIHK